MLTARRDGPTKPGKLERTAKNNRGRAMADETATLAAYVADLKFEDIPREVLERAKVLTLDFLGSASGPGAMRNPPLSLLKNA